MPQIVSAKFREQLYQRKQEIDALLYKALIARGHTSASETGCVVIQGEKIDWRFYETSVQRKIPLTQKEAQSILTSEAAKRRGWRPDWEPGGFLALLIDADFHSEMRIVETRKHPFEGRIEAVVDRFEKIAAETAERRIQQQESLRRAAEAQMRRQERARLQAIEDRKWDEFTGLASDWEKARQLRCFIVRVTRLNDATPDPSGRVREWLLWTRANVDALDPLADGIEGFLERLFPPEPSEYELNFGEPEDIGD